MWYTFLGTSPGGIIAQLVVLFGAEIRRGWWRLGFWREQWRSGLKRAAYALGAVWIVAFVGSAAVTIYDDHQALAAANHQLRKKNATLSSDRDEWKRKFENKEQEKSKIVTERVPVISLAPTPHSNVGLAGTAVSQSDTPEGGTSVKIKLTFQNGETQNKVHFAVHEFFGDRELLPVVAPRDYDLGKKDVVEMELAPYLSPKSTAKFKKDGGRLRVLVTADYSDGAKSLRYTVEGEAGPDQEHLNILAGC